MPLSAATIARIQAEQQEAFERATDAAAEMLARDHEQRSREERRNGAHYSPPRIEARELTDTGNAARFAAAHGDNVRWTPERAWLVWNSRRWQVDEGGRVVELAKQTARAMFDEIRDAESSRQEVELFRWAQRSQGADRLRAMLYLARSSDVRKLKCSAALPWVDAIWLTEYRRGKWRRRYLTGASH